MVVMVLPSIAAQRQHAGAHRDAVDVHRARTAQRHAAAVLGARHPQVIAQHPQQRRVGRRVDLKRLIVDGYRCHLELSQPCAASMLRDSAEFEEPAGTRGRRARC